MDFVWVEALSLLLIEIYLVLVKGIIPHFGEYVFLTPLSGLYGAYEGS